LTTARRATAPAAISEGDDMVYELRDQDVTPPEPDPEDVRSSKSDARGALGIAVLTIALIVTIIWVQIL